MKKRSKPVAQIAVEGPARIRPEHVRDRNLSIVAGADKGFRVIDWPIQIAHEAKTGSRLDGTDKNGEMRWLAIKTYAKWLALGDDSKGRDSTQLDIVMGGGGGDMSDECADAKKKRISVDSFMALKDRTIVRKLCEGWSLPGAVREVCGDDFKFAVAARVRDALDALIGAMEAARRSNYRVDMGVR